MYQRALRQEWARREEEESNRLLYVAMTRAEQHLVLSFSATGRRPANWDKLVTERLALDISAPGDQLTVYHAPGGQPWKARVRIVGQASWPVPQPISRPHEPKQEMPAIEAALPSISEQQDSNATVTALSLFAACPRKYYLSRYLGFEASPRKPADSTLCGDATDLSAAQIGTQVHSLLAGIPVPEAQPEALRLAQVVPQSPLGRRAAHATRVAREFDFLMAMEDLVIRGQVDLWFEEGGELIVADYKTDQVTAAEAHQRARDYALQLRLYALAVERVAGRAPDRAFIHFLRPNILVEVDLTPSLIESPEQIVRDFQEAQSKLDFPLIEGQHCKRCAFYRDLCPAGLSLAE